jgi:hypothetical protein
LTAKATAAARRFDKDAKQRSGHPARERIAASERGICRSQIPWGTAAVFAAVPPIPLAALRSLHVAQDYKGMVRLTKQVMNVEVSLRIVWVPEGAAETGATKGAPTWISVPKEMPAYGTKAFKDMRLDLYLRRSFLQRSSHDRIAIAIAHELSHVVLDSIHHPFARMLEGGRSYRYAAWISRHHFLRVERRLRSRPAREITIDLESVLVGAHLPDLQAKAPPTTPSPQHSRTA